MKTGWLVVVSMALCQGSVSMAPLDVEGGMDNSVSIGVNVAEEQGAIRKDVAGMMHIIHPDITKLPLHTKVSATNVIPALNSTYVRLGWGGDVLYGLNPWPAEGQYNWDRLDELIEFYLSRGREVLLPLSLTPRWLWSDPNDPELNTPIPESIFKYMMKGHTLPPSDYAKWEELIYQTVKHLNVDRKYGVNFEGWNEVNISWFWSGTVEQSLELHEHTARAVRRADPAAVIGAPSGVPSDVFLDYCIEHDVPVDFIPWHFYLWTVNRKNPNSRFSFAKQTDRFKECIRRNPAIGNPELFVTEWSYFWGSVDTPAPTFVAAYLAQSLYEMADSGVSAAFHCGPIGSPKNPKPGYHIFKMFDMLGSTRVRAEVAENGSSVQVLCSKNGDKVTLMVWDFPYRMEKMENLNKSVRIALENLPRGDYKMVRYLVDDDHMGSQTMERVEDQQIHADAKAELEFELVPYGVTFIELTADDAI